MRTMPRIQKSFIIFLIVLLALPGVLSSDAKTAEAAGASTASVEVSIDNPGFESGDLTGWTVTGATYAALVKTVPVMPISETMLLITGMTLTGMSSVCRKRSAG